MSSVSDEFPNIVYEPDYFIDYLFRWIILWCIIKKQLHDILRFFKIFNNVIKYFKIHDIL